MSKDEIFREAVIGWAVFEMKRQREAGSFLWFTPLAVNYEGIPDEDNLEMSCGEKVVAVIPAAPGTFQVLGVMPDGSCKVLGYEVPGAYHPDWQEELRELKKKKGETK